MTAKTTVTKKKIPQPQNVISNCTFHGGVSELSVGVLAQLAEAALENAIAIQAITKAVKGPDTMISMGY